MQTGIPVVNTFAHAITASGTTAAKLLIPPCPGPPGSPPYVFNALASYAPLTSAPSQTHANWLSAAPLFGIPHISTIRVEASSTAHVLLILRPLNWTYFPAGLAKNTTVIPDSALTGIADDPGVYSTNYKYPTVGGAFPAQVADAAVSSTNTQVCYQLADGTWQLDTIASGTFGSTLTLTTGTPNRAGGAIPTGGVLFYFGALAGTLKDPATGLVAWSMATIVSVTTGYQDYLQGEYAAIHPGDPLFIYDANATAADSIEVTGYYGSY